MRRLLSVLIALALPAAAPWRKIFLVAALVGAAAAASFILRGRGFDPRQAGEWMNAVGDRWWAPVAFIALYAIFSTTLLPATILTLTAGVVWGWLAGGFWVLAASTIGSAIPYGIAYSGSAWVEGVMSRKAPRMRDALKTDRRCVARRPRARVPLLRRQSEVEDARLRQLIHRDPRLAAECAQQSVAARTSRRASRRSSTTLSNQEGAA